MDLADLDLENAEQLLNKQKNQPEQIQANLDQQSINQQPNNQEQDKDTDKEKKRSSHHHRSSSRKHSESKSKRKSSKSKSKSGSHSRKHKRHSKSKEQKSSKHHHHHRHHSHSSSRSSKHDQNGSLNKEDDSVNQEEAILKDKQDKIDQTKNEIKLLETKIQQAQKEAEEAKREDLTILIYSLPNTSKEKDIHKYLQMNNVGKIRDIRIIRDNKTRKSKGVAYVEFFQTDSVQKALSLNNKPFIMDGKEIKYSEIKVQPSYAEKNRAALAAKQIKQSKMQLTKEQTQLLNQSPMRIYIGGLVDSLKDITDDELRNLFSSFGEIEFVDVHRDQVTNACKGFAFIQYKKAEDAKVAIQQMNNYQIKDKKITVSTVPTQQSQNMQVLQQYQQQQQQSQQQQQQQQPQQKQQQSEQPGQQQQQDQSQQQQQQQEGGIDLDITEDLGSAYLRNSSARISLMQKLSGNEFPMPNVNLLQPVMGAQGQNAHGATGGADANGNPLMLLQLPLQNLAQRGGGGNQQQISIPPKSQLPTRCIVIKNLFTGEEAKDEPTFYADLMEEIEDECKKYGQIDQIAIDRKTTHLGMVLIKFADIKHAVNCQNVMNNRYFDNKQIQSYHITEACFQSEMQRLDER